MKKSILLAAVAAAVTLTPATVLADLGKCYGVAEAGKNDCAPRDKSHTCAGEAKKDNDSNDWMHMSKADCEKDPNNKGWEAAKMDKKM